RLKEWASQLEIPPLTESLFRERIAPTHKPRASSLNQFSRQLRGDHSGIYSFHRPLSDPIVKKQLNRSPFPHHLVTAISGINKHPFSLTALGILPNQFRKIWNPDLGDPELALDHLR